MLALKKMFKNIVFSYKSFPISWKMSIFATILCGLVIEGKLCTIK